MFRLSRRLTTALLWLAIALLPLRGWASVLMPATMGDVSAAVAAEASSAMPCHGDAAHDADGVTAASRTCSLCDVCNGSVMQASPVALQLPALPDAPPPSARQSAVEPRAPDSLFRPPRAFLA